MKPHNISSVDEYIKSFPTDVQKKLHIIRSAIRSIVPPETQERIRYQIPTYYFHENLIHFAAFKNHISFFPTSSGVSAFRDQLSKYKCSKGTIQIPLSEELPIDLLKDIVRFRVREVMKELNVSDVSR